MHFCTAGDYHLKCDHDAYDCAGHGNVKKIAMPCLQGVTGCL